MLWLLPLVLVGVYLLYRGFFIEPDALRLEQVTVHVPWTDTVVNGVSDWTFDATLAGGGARGVGAGVREAGGQVRRASVGGKGVGAADATGEAGAPAEAIDNEVRILHVTDLHLRDEPDYEMRLVELARSARPHLIALTGDYVDEPRLLFVLERVVHALGKISPVCAVLGDNDLEGKRLSPEDIQHAMQRARAHVMRNQGGYVRFGSFDLFICGIDDPRAPSSDLERALKMRYVDAMTILLSHSAEAYPAAEMAGVDVMLAGHTHGGQVCLPWFGALYTNDRLGRRFASGMIQRDGLQMHVGRGVGWAKLRVRLFCPPEVTLISLRRQR